ncbi:MAG: thiol protease/hemagglutinin PrtT [Bacteroidota bacterium]
MKKSTFFIPLLLCIISFNLNAKSINAEKAKQAAVNFLYQRSDITEKSDFSISLLKEIKDENTKEPLCYVFSLLPKGFVIMSADDNLQPVIGYSYEDDFIEFASPSFNAWMNGYYKQISFALQNKSIDNSKNNAWAELENKSGKKQLLDKAPMITTKWDQANNYNALCPLDSLGPDGHALVGCVATAMGQIMKFWNYPEHGNSGYAYQHIPPMFANNYGKVEANFAITNYEWTNMPTKSNSTSKIAVSTLLYHCGVSVKMMYGPDGSGSFTDRVPSALAQYFSYSPAVKYIERSIYPNPQWDAMMMYQLNIGLPVLYSGSGPAGGHAFVLDGYQDSSYFHINWGWSGANNGYFYFTSLNSGNGDFTGDQGAVVDIYPLGHVSVPEINSESAMVYPNPAQDFIIIEGFDANKASVDIFNNIGQLVLSNVENSKVDVSNLENGLYFVKVKTDSKSSVSKVFIQR